MTLWPHMLTILLIQIIQSGEFSFGQVLLSFFIQFSVGGIAGYLLGRCAVYTLNHFRILNQSLPDCSSDLCIFHFLLPRKTSGERLSGGIYCRTGRRESPIVYKRILPIFSTVQPGFSKLSCFTLGLLVNPKDLISISWLGLLIGIFYDHLRPSRQCLIVSPAFPQDDFKSRLYVCWVGLRGAVPIIFATYPLIANIPGAHQIFQYRVLHHPTFSIDSRNQCHPYCQTFGRIHQK